MTEIVVKQDDTTEMTAQVEAMKRPKMEEKEQVIRKEGAQSEVQVGVAVKVKPMSISKR